ncbi:hypothetical protein G6F48_013435 [Rhizopus delemar]|nr:hypothetical protein G6F48_013435 [Rhizopus delemar]
MTLFLKDVRHSSGLPSIMHILDCLSDVLSATVYARASIRERTTKKDSELSNQGTAKTKQNQLDRTQEDSEEGQTKGRTGSDHTRGSDGESDDRVRKDSLLVYQAANQDANEPRESVLHGLQEHKEWDQPPEQGDMRVREPG